MNTRVIIRTNHLPVKVKQTVGSFHGFHMPVEEGGVTHFRAVNGGRENPRVPPRRIVGAVQLLGNGFIGSIVLGEADGRNSTAPQFQSGRIKLRGSSLMRVHHHTVGCIFSHDARRKSMTSR